MKTLLKIVLVIFLIPHIGISQGIIILDLKINNKNIILENNFDAYFYYQEGDSVFQSDVLVDRNTVVIGEKLFDTIPRFLVVKYDDYYFNIKMPNFGVCDRCQRFFNFGINYLDSDCIDCNTDEIDLCREKNRKYKSFVQYLYLGVFVNQCVENIKQPPIIGKIKWE